jgi:Rhodanese-related sulfurtransferase
MSGLESKIKAGAMVVDVRTAEEFREEHYPNALNIPIDQIRQRLVEFGEKSASIVVYCATGSRSAYAAKMLKSAGYTDILNAGGLEDMPRN